MKIIIIDHEPYNERRENHFFLNKFRAEGHEVAYWCIWKVLPYSKHVQYSYQGTGKDVYYFTSKKDLRVSITALDPSNTFIFVEFRLNSGSFYIFEIFNKRQLKWGRLDYYHNPAVNFYNPVRIDPVLSFVTRLVNKGKFLQDIAKHICDYPYLKFQYLSKINKKYFNQVQTAAVCFITGANTTHMNPSKNYTALDYFDIIKYNEEQRKPALLDYPYIVFADIYLGKHPDIQIDNPNSYMDVMCYYKKLNQFFKTIEQALNMPVVIAAHPKSSYTDEFEGRLCIKNETANLIINSKLMVQHCSLSISFALLSKKNVIHFYTNEFLTTPVLLKFYEVIENISMLTDTASINIDKPFDIIKLFQEKVNTQAYQQILEKYFIKPQAENRSNFDIVLDTIKKIV